MGEKNKRIGGSTSPRGHYKETCPELDDMKSVKGPPKWLRNLALHKVHYQVSDQQGEQREASDHTWPENQNDYGLLTRNTESWDSMREGGTLASTFWMKKDQNPRFLDPDKLSVSRENKDIPKLKTVLLHAFPQKVTGEGENQERRCLQESVGDLPRKVCAAPGGW